MSTAALNTSSHDSNSPRTLNTSRTDSSLQAKANMFQSMKDKLKRSPSKTATANMHPQSNSTPSTRRPENPPTTKNPFRDMGEAPPPYSASASAPTPAPAARASSPSPLPSSSSNIAAPASAPQDNDPYAFLTSFDTLILVDDSGSMAGGRWRETKEALESITPICTAHDADGIDIYFLNCPDTPAHFNITSAATVSALFARVRPGGATPTGQKLNAILKPYLARYAASPDATKPINIICITDGEPSDDVESPLIQAAKKLDKLDAPAWQVGVQFFQVGNDVAASKHLASLDDELAEIAGDDEMRDIVDTVPFRGVEGAKLSGEGILKVVLGAVNRRLDRKKAKGLHE